MLLFLFLLALVQASSSVYRVYVTSYNVFIVLDRLKSFSNIDVWSESIDQWIDLQIPAQSTSFLQGLNYTTLIDNVPEKLQNSATVDTFQKMRLVGAVTSQDFFQDYQSTETVNSFLSQVAEPIEIGYTFENRTITAFKTGQGPKNIVLLGGVHAREWISVAVTCFLTYNLATDPALKSIRNKYTIYTIPVFNVDGYEYTRTKPLNRLWRKSRQIINGSSCIGVDLNRNFPFQWDSDSIFSNQTSNPCEEVYRGKAPGDTPEVAAFLNFIDKKTVSLFIDIHSYSQMWLYPFGFSCVETPASSDILSEGAYNAVDAIQKNSSTAYVAGDVCSTLYTVTGSSTDYMYSVKNSTLSYALELRDKGNQGFLLDKSQIIPTGQETYSAVISIVESMRKACAKGTMNSISRRKLVLRKLYETIEEMEKEICEALYKDLNKDYNTSYGTEILISKNEISLALEEIDEWTRPVNVSKNPLLNAFDKCQIRYQPYGLSLIISPWNYPFLLIINPLISAIAAGNCVLLKPSEVSVHTCAVLTKLVEKVNIEELKVVNGAVKETQALLEQRFDHIFYTGNGTVARIIMAAASKHLTPVVLELGGKSPVVIDRTVDIETSAKRIFWAKSLNAGQICIAPDYVMCPKDLIPQFVQALKKAQLEFFGSDISKSSLYCKIINQNHFKRLMNLLEKQTKIPGTVVEIGGQYDESRLFIAPTVLVGVTKDSVIMADEIFGPILPIVAIESVDEAIEFINSRPKPLALYVFSKENRVCNRVINSTSSGGAIANDCLMNMTVDSLPFGGVGESGMGSYHGKHGFESFSHKRSVMLRPHQMELLNKPRYPPLGDFNLNLMKAILEKNPNGNKILHRLFKRIPVKILLWALSIAAAVLLTIKFKN